jgi:hypothetical protein
VIIGPDGNVVRSGSRSFGNRGQFVLEFRDLVRPGQYTIAAALYVDGNSMNPEIQLIGHRVAGGVASPGPPNKSAEGHRSTD